MRWTEIVPKKILAKSGGAVTSIKIMNAEGKVLADITNDVDGIELGGTKIPVHHSGVTSTVQFTMNDGNELEMPTRIKAVRAGDTIEVGT